MNRFLIATILIAGLFMQSCSKKSNGDINTTTGNNGTVETATIKYIPDSMFRAYLKANVCPDAFDKTGKFIDITNSEVKNFSGIMQIDTVTCPAPYVQSLKGIQYFTNMKKLTVQESGLDSLDLSTTMGLDTLRILDNIDLQYVALSGCTSMRYIRAFNIPAVSLDFSNLPAINCISLVTLQRLGDLKTNNDANLQTLVLYNVSSLRTVNLSTNPALNRICLEYSGITSLDVTHNPKLYMIDANEASSLKNIDVSKNDSLESALFDDCLIDSIDFSHNPKLYNVSMMRTPVRNLSFLANPKLCVLSLDGCGQLQTVDLRAQHSFDFWYAPAKDYVALTVPDRFEVYQHSLASPVQTAQCYYFGAAQRAGVNGATQSFFAGLRVPQYLDGNGFALTQVKVDSAIKDNVSLVMARNVIGMTPPLITVYADDESTILCNDYDPKSFTCNH
jgi:hypothetical protein